jgi:hypothetical protein
MNRPGSGAWQRVAGVELMRATSARAVCDIAFGLVPVEFDERAVMSQDIGDSSRSGHR